LCYGFTTVAYASGKTNFYAGFKLASESVTDSKISIVDRISVIGSALGRYKLGTDSNGSYEYARGLGLGVSLGCSLGKKGRVEVETMFSDVLPLSSDSSYNEVKLESDDAGDPDLVVENNGFFASATMVNLYYDFPDFLKIVPYFGAGVGKARVSALGVGNNTAAYQVKLGMSRGIARKESKIGSALYCNLRYISTLGSVFKQVSFAERTSGVGKSAKADISQKYGAYALEAGVNFNL
jgi:opacity protein-like surface antigen